MTVKDFLDVFEGYTNIWVLDKDNDAIIAHGTVHDLQDDIQLSDSELKYSINSIKLDPLGDIELNCFIPD